MQTNSSGRRFILYAPHAYGGARMTRPKKHPDAKVPQESVRAVAREIKKRMPLYGSQKSIAEFLGISQPMVSRFLGALEEPKKATQPFEPGADVMAQAAGQLGIEWRGPGVGMRRAGVEESTDMLPNRGRALDALSAEYPADLLQALKRHAPPAGHEKWTFVRWLEYLIELKKAWESGLIELSGMPRKNGR